MAADPRPRATRGARRPGFALLGSILVLVAIVMVTAAVVTPSLVVATTQARVHKAKDILWGWTEDERGIVQFEDSVGSYPGRLSQLSTPIVDGDLDICGKPYKGNLANLWKGPHADRVLPRTGTPVGIGIAQDSLGYEYVSNSERYLIIRIPGVAETDATQLDRITDPKPGQTTAKVHWTDPDAEGTVTVLWKMEITSC